MIYKTLFNFNLLHAYFLDNGEEKYHADNINDELSVAEKEEALSSYKLSDCIQILPNKKTKMITKNYKLLVRKHAAGIRILVSTLVVNAQDNTETVERFNPFIELPEDLVLTFYIKATDNYFENYTDIIAKKEKQLYYLSNISSSVTNVFDANGSIEKWEDFLLTEAETRKLLYQLEKENEFANTTPKLVTIADIDEAAIDAVEVKVTNETDLNEEEQEILDALNQAVTVAKNNSIIGVIQLKIVGDNTTEFTEEVNTEDPSTGNFDLPKQCLLEDEIDFQIYIENKKTFWRYNQSGTEDKIITKELKPLTKNGKIELGEADVNPETADVFFPNPTAESITTELENYYSEIFI